VRVTVLEAIQKSTDFLGKKNVESPRLQVELLLAHLLKLPRMKLYLNFDRVLTAAETDALREMVKRRGLREPLQHIVGSTSFCGFEIAVNRHALVPRPETELLAELGCQFLSNQHPTSNPASSAELSGPRGTAEGGRRVDCQPPTANAEMTALDFGTGTGCIAVVLAAKCPGAQIVALDISADALALAKRNAAANGVNEQIEFLRGDGFTALTGRTDAGTGLPRPVSFDLIISNPPYIPSAEIASLEPEVRDFDPRAALDGGADGLDFYRALAVQAKPFLKADGKIMVEFGDGQADTIKKIFADETWAVEAVKEDYSQRSRIIVARSSPPVTFQVQAIRGAPLK
jgi:release factor glutamine methyltransferase